MTSTRHLRTLPIAVHPEPDETFHSWTVRLATTLNVDHLTALFTAGYLNQQSRLDPAGSGYGLLLTSTATANLAHTTRATPQALHDTLLTVYDGGPLTTAGLTLNDKQLVRKLGVREWVLIGNSKACPPCLAENGHVWRLPWRLPWATTCTKHQILLEHVCPTCRTPFNAGYRLDMSVGVSPRRQPVSNTHCTAAAVGADNRLAKCEHLFAQIPTHACRTPELLRAQEQVDALLAPAHRSSHARWWKDLRATSALVLTHASLQLLTDLIPNLPPPAINALETHYTERDNTEEERRAAQARSIDHRHTRRQSNFLKTPLDSAIMAPVMTVALSVLNDLGLPAPIKGDRGPLKPGTALNAIAEAVNARGRSLRSEFRARKASEPLQDAVSAMNDHYRVAKTLTPLALTGITTDNIPQLWPQEQYEQVAHLLRGTGTTDEYARQYLSLAAAKLLTGQTWYRAGAAIGLAPATAVSCSRTVPLRITDLSTLHAIHQHIRDTLTTMSERRADELPNYRRLAKTYGRVQAISTHRWNTICRHAGADLYATDARRRNYAAWEWHTIALMPLTAWPGWEPFTNKQSAREVYFRFVRRDIPQLHPEYR